MTHDRSLGAENDPFPDFGLSKMGDDRLREECGVFGVFGHPDAAAITALGLHRPPASRTGSGRYRHL